METSLRAACYIRVSTEDQTEYSPDAQRKALESYAEQHGMTIDPKHIYVDAGISGRKASARPAFMAMIAAAKRKPPPFDLILVYKLDRFARNREDSIVYKSMLRRQCGVRVVSITEHLEDDRMGLILEAMLEAMAEYYSINLGEEVRKGMTEKARRGELQTAPPFGYRAEENRLVPEQSEAGVVRELYRRFLAGESIHALTCWAREQGVLSRRGNPLDGRGIRYILGNPAYTGMLRWGRDEEGRALLSEGGHPPLVDRTVFLSVQDMLAKNASRCGRHARPFGSRKHWLSGLVKCAVCGGGMILTQSHYLRCGRYVKGKCSPSQHIPADALEAAILEQLRCDADGEGGVVVTPVSTDQQEREDAFARQTAAAERKLDRLREAYLCGAETVEEYRAQKLALQRQMEQLRAAWEREQAASSPVASAEEWQRAADRLTAPEADLEDRYRAACAVFASCVWDKGSGRVTLTYRWSPND